MSDRLQHVVISASAGSGKTYQLVRRYLLLLAWGVEPEKIAAMTFTKKASGEFFNRILNRLAELAAGELDANKFFAGMSPLPLQWPDFRFLLRRTTQAMQQLRLGTLDSFFASITACFPLELGLPFGASVMPEDEAQRVKSEVLGSLIERLYRKRDDQGMSTMLEAFKLATYGAEEKRADEALMKWVARGHDLWLELPDLSRWGGVEAIWPDGGGARAGGDSLMDAVERVRRAIDPAAKFTAAAAETWESILDDIVTMTPGLSLPKGAETLLEKCSEVWKDLMDGSATLTFRKKYEFRGEEAASVVALCRCIIGRELLVRCQRALGAGRVLAEYEREYGERVRDQGRLTFSDVTRLVGNSAREWLGQAEGADLWYRLDARYEHWLFDEFQDTSYLQWRVVSGLVDEVIQSERGERSFFAVGDPKQSIYLWRQAEPRLFRQVANLKDGNGKPVMRAEQLLTSFRSAPPVLEAVNLVCVKDDVLSSLLPGADRDWECEAHVASGNAPGYATLMWPLKREDQDEVPKPEDVVIALLQEIRPLDRGLSCAVLVRQNDKGRELAERIRLQTGMEVVCESEQEPAVDNPVTLAILALFQLSAHPADGHALAHLRMTPLWPYVDSAESGRFRTCAQVLRQVSAEGFASVVHEWIRHAREAAGDAWDAFAELRGKQLGDMAAEFDETGSRDVDAFLAFASSRRLRVRGGREAVQVMTVHASKGLEFDMVILPELSGKAMNHVKTRDFVSKRDDEGRLQWVTMEAPHDVARMDEVLGAELAEAESRAEFESLCRLYVAMTRAKRGLYMITVAPPKTTEGSMNEARVLRERLGDAGVDGCIQEVAVNLAWQTGKPDWYGTERVTERFIVSSAEKGSLGDLLRKRQPMVPRVTPSGQEDFKVTGQLLFSSGRERGKALGNLVHEMLSLIEWDTNVDWSSFASKLGYRDAVKLIGDAMKHDQVREVFHQPGGQVELWRERSFDVILPGKGWISGTFDRVVVDRDAGIVTIIDFKTDDLGPELERLTEKRNGYEPQLELYRDSVMRLTGLSTVRCKLVFLRSGHVEEW